MSHLLCRYFYELLNQYSKLMTYKPTRHPEAIPFKYSALGVCTVSLSNCWRLQKPEPGVTWDVK